MPEQVRHDGQGNRNGVHAVGFVARSNVPRKKRPVRVRNLGPRHKAGGDGSANGRAPALLSRDRGLRAFEIHRREEPLGIQRRHAAGAGGSHGLAVMLVHHIAAREHARHTGPRGAALDLDIMIAVELDMSSVQLGLRVILDRDLTALGI